MTNSLYETNTELPDRAILVSLTTQEVKNGGVDPAYSMDELVQLALTAGVEVADTLVQNRDKPDPKWFIGKGKVDELHEAIQDFNVTTVIFDQELSGAQVRNLEDILDVKIIDRTQLILDIFAQRAKTREGIIQVELAQLTYLLPRLSGHGKNLSRLGGGIGTRGPGEQAGDGPQAHPAAYWRAEAAVGGSDPSPQAAPGTPQGDGRRSFGIGGLHERRQIDAAQSVDCGGRIYRKSAVRHA